MVCGLWFGACVQEYVAAVAQDQTAAAEKAAMLMSATGGSPAGLGSEYVIEPPSTLTAEDSDNGSDGENDDDIPLDRQASPHVLMMGSQYIHCEVVKISSTEVVFCRATVFGQLSGQQSDVYGPPPPPPPHWPTPIHTPISQASASSLHLKTT